MCVWKFVVALQHVKIAQQKVQANAFPAFSIFKMVVSICHTYIFDFRLSIRLPLLLKGKPSLLALPTHHPYYVDTLRVDLGGSF